jgi:hypothetical protein
MSKLLISYVNDWAAGTVTASSEHPSFPAVNTQHRWFKKPWRSKYGTGSAWGLFRITAANQNIYFNEGAGNLTCALTIGDYDTVTICAEIKSKMDAAGATYTPVYSETTPGYINKFTVSITTGTFKFLLSNQTNAIWDTLGFTGVVDTALAALHTADEIRIHTGELVYCNFGSVKTIKDIVLKNHNLQSTAVIQARYYSDAFITLVDTETLTWHAGQIGIRTEKIYQYAAFYISDPDNPAGYVEMGLAWFGGEFIPHYGYNGDREAAPQDPSIVTSSEDGQESTIQMSHFKEWGYFFDAMTAADRVTWAAVFAIIGATRPCFIVEAPSAADIGLTAQYVRLMEWKETHVVGAFWALELSVRSER